VVIITGTGNEFSGPRANPGTSSFPTRPPIERIDRIHWEGRHLLTKLLDIEVPIISAVNGPAWRHSEIPLLCDIVLAADTAQFRTRFATGTAIRRKSRKRRRQGHDLR
jgi:enoyl-CoA hydratase/carnithine racemase